MTIADAWISGLEERLSAALLKGGQRRVMGYSFSEETVFLATQKPGGEVEVIIMAEDGQQPPVELLPEDVVWLETPVDDP